MAAKASLAYTAWDTAAALSGPWLEAIHLGTVLRLAEGETLYEQNDIHDYFYLVRAGFVHTSLLRSNGAQLLVEIFGPKAIFGEAPAFSGLPRTREAATAARAGSVWRVGSGSITNRPYMPLCMCRFSGRAWQ